VGLRDRLEQTGKRFYCVCFTLRSGSTLLCEDLAQWSLGTPTESFQLPRHGDEGESLADVVFETVAASPGPTFGFKATWEQAFLLAERLRAEGEADASFDLRSVFPDLRSAHLVRRDKVAQAISIWRAVESGTWHWPVGQQVDKGHPEYDFEAIRAYLVQVVAEEWLWSSHFQRLGVPHVRLDYESYVEHRARSLRSLAGFLGLKAVRAPLVDRLNVMRDEWTEEIAARVWADLDRVPEPVRLVHVAPQASEGPAEVEAATARAQALGRERAGRDERA
jgi:trehalose 2-sulfotransferase